MRGRLNAATTSADLFAVLESEKLAFTYPEFDDAYHSLLVQCQEAEQAERLKEFKMWWDLIQAMTAP